MDGPDIWGADEEESDYDQDDEGQASELDTTIDTLMRSGIERFVVWRDGWR